MSLTNLFLFLLVCGVTGFVTFVASLVGIALGEIQWFVGILAGSVVGIMAAVTLASWLGLLERAEWSTVVRFSSVGFFGGVLVVSLNGLSEALIIIIGAVGSGSGAILGKFLDRFFINRPPQRLF